MYYFLPALFGLILGHLTKRLINWLGIDDYSIKLNNIFHAVDERVKTVQCKKESKRGCNGKATKCITHNLWDELEMHINTFFENKSLKDLMNNNKETRV